MSQRKGIHRLLENPEFYELVQKMFAHKPTKIKWDKALGSCTSKTVLDLGCGTGKLAPELKAGHYIGIDISPACIEVAKADYGDHGEFYCLSVDDLQTLAPQNIDVILMLGVLHHLSDSQVRSLFILLSRALSDDGFILTLDPELRGHFNLSNLLVSFDRGMHVRDQTGYMSLVTDFLMIEQSESIAQLLPPFRRLLMKIRKRNSR
jgi:2-polyprenyl-3-methyl-5-hydroxy-6-metoxy-1,4-benzoquinol methylase